MAKSKGGRKPVSDKKALIGIYIPQSWIETVGADVLRRKFGEVAKRQAVASGLKNIS